MPDMHQLEEWNRARQLLAEKERVHAAYVLKHAAGELSAEDLANAEAELAGVRLLADEVFKKARAAGAIQPPE